MIDETEARRRPRREAVQMGAEAAPEAQSSAGNFPGRRRRASVGGHALKLAAPQRDGFVRRWVNDTDNRIANAQELAYDFATEEGIKSTDAGSRVSRLVGTKANGEPLRAYLMETPVEEYAAGAADKEAPLRQFDSAIADGRDTTGQMSANETYGHGSISRDR